MSEAWLYRLFGKGAPAEDLERQKNRRLGLVCPHCGAPSKIRSSHQNSLIYAEQLRHCKNPLCGHVWVVGIYPIRTLVLPAVPNPEIDIPLSRHIQRNAIELYLSRYDATEQPDIFTGSDA